MKIQTTLNSAIEIEGVGLHSGLSVSVRISPAPANHGIVFSRIDLPGQPLIAADYKNVVSTQLATTLGMNQIVVSTVEHLCAAIYGFGLDNLLIEVSGPEVPVLDGSALKFYDAFTKIGSKQQAVSQASLIVRKKIELQLGDKRATVEPSHRFELHSSIEWNHPLIGRQSFSYIEGKTDFREIAASRTFGFFEEVEYLRKQGLAKGGSLENAVVLDQTQVLNPEGLRYQDEFIRHKVLDALGDLKLSGYALQAKFTLHRGGHDLHCQLLKELFRNPENYEVSSSTLPRAESKRFRLIRGFAASY